MIQVNSRPRLTSDFAEPPSFLLPAPDVRTMRRYGNSRLGLAIGRGRQLLARWLNPLRVWLYARSSVGRKSSEALNRLHNSQSGAVGVVVCNGPSLRGVDWESLGGAPYILMNRGYLVEPSIGYPPVAVCAHDPAIISNFAAELRDVNGLLLTSVEGSRRIGRKSSAIYLRIDRSWKFATRLRASSHHGATVTFWALELAYHLGWSKVLIVGMDHRYSESGAQGSITNSTGEGKDHFIEGYFKPGMRVMQGDMKLNDYSYMLANAAFKADGREIVDCTIGGECRVFRKGAIEHEIMGAQN